MKNLGKLKLNQISKVELEKREMNFLRGGGCSTSCQCTYGGAMTMDNDSASYETQACNCTCSCPCTDEDYRSASVSVQGAYNQSATQAW